jgi:uncharacterized membrane protein
LHFEEDPAMAIRRAMQPTIHPALMRAAEVRAAYAQNRIADGITVFAGSMIFVYIHIAWFIAWIAIQPFGDKFPFGLLTMIVSLEAIFLSTFVMISQNRADERRQALADDQWKLVQLEGTQNQELLNLVQLENTQSQELLKLSQQMLALTQQVHALTLELRESVKGTSPAE